MFYFIKGTLEGAGKDFAVIDNNGIGYRIYVNPATMSRINNLKDKVMLYTYFHVREDIAALYGFVTKEELDMFELLISVSGIGPKAGLAILSTLTPSKIGLAIMGGDTKILSSAPGIGVKTAHRIILELKDKIDNNEVLELAYDKEKDTGGSIQEAINALISLGYSASEASSAIRRMDTSGKDTEEIIKEALKILLK